jgi:hypothetical protein
MLVSTSVVCRAANGTCDLAEYCNATGFCPPDRYEPNGFTCRPNVSFCDATEYCNGTSPSCPADSCILSVNL